jgi:hypothetical protein
MVDTVIVENEQAPRSAVSWPAVIAGAVVIAALSLLLLMLGSGIGFSVISPWASNGAIPETTKAATVAGIYLTVTAVLAGAVGGYITGRLRNLWPGVHSHEAFFRDTAHGFVAWALATLIGAALLGSMATTIAGGAAHEATRASMHGLDAAGLPGLTDKLFTYDYVAVSKTQGGQPVTGIARDYEGDRATANRILARLAMHDRVLTDEERQTLNVIVAARTGLALPDAEKRVAGVEADARRAADTARRVATMLSFWLVASMFAGALAASLGAWEGGGIRDGRYRYGI